MLTKKILIDTDIGDDIDDLIALEYLLKQENVEIVGITTTFKNTALRARMAKKACALLNKDIPVFAGAGKPLASVYPTREDEIFCQYEKDLEDPKWAPSNKGKSRESAVDFIVECAEKYGESLTILAIGPLTNLALALQKNEPAMKKTRLRLMGGCFFRSFSEWNIECDYLAAETVFQKADDLYAVGIDVTEKTQLTPDEEKWFLEDSSPYGSFRNRCIKSWHEASPGRVMTLHDPLAAMSLLSPTIVGFLPRHVHVCTEGEFTTGMTLPIEELRGPLYEETMSKGHPLCHVASSLNLDEFKETIRKTIKKGA